MPTGRARELSQGLSTPIPLEHYAVTVITQSDPGTSTTSLGVASQLERGERGCSKIPDTIMTVGVQNQGQNQLPGVVAKNCGDELVGHSLTKGKGNGQLLVPSFHEGGSERDPCPSGGERDGCRPIRGIGRSKMGKSEWFASVLTGSGAFFLLSF